MSDMRVGVQIRADGRGLVSTMKQTRGQVLAFDRSLKTTNTTAQKTTRNLSNMDAATGRLGKRMNTTTQLMRGFRGGLIGIVAAMGITQFIRYSDQMTNLQNQLRLVTKSTKDLADTQAALLNVSNQTRSSFTATTELYTKLFRATGDLNVTQGELLSVTRAINQAFIISGASAAEAEGSTRQLAQALASGAFRGDEFNSVAEQAPRLMAALAAETGKSTGELRALAAEGKLTSEILVRALVNQSSVINQEFSQTNATIAQAGTVTNNNMKALVGTFNDITGTSSAVANGILGIGNAMGRLNTAINSGQLAAYFDALLDNFGVSSEGISSGLDVLSDAFGAWFDFVIDNYKRVGNAILFFPQNVRFMAKRLIEEFKFLVQIGKSYGQQFSQVIQAELAELKSKVGVIANELADQMQFWDGDTYDYGEAIAAAGNVAEGMTAEYIAAKDKQVAAAKAVRSEALSAISAERDASIASFDAQIVKANALATAHREAANAASFTPDAEGSTGGVFNISDGSEVTDAELTRLRESLFTKEEAIGAHYAKQQTLINEALVQQKIREDEHNDLSLRAHKQYMDEKANYSMAKNNLIFNSAQQIFGGLASLAQTFGGKQSKAFKVMFAIQKGFSIAQGTLNLATAISNAFALPFPANIPAIGVAVTQGASLLANIKGAQYQGQAHDGLRRVTADNEGTYTVRRDEMVLNPRQRENFERVAETVTNEGRNSSPKTVHFSPTFHIDASNAVPGMETRIQESVTQALMEYDETLMEDFATNGTRAKTLSGRAA